MSISNKDIAGVFRKLADIMELHEENPFKIRSYRTAYQTLRKQKNSIAIMSREEIASLDGIGTAITDKILEYLDTKQLATYERYRELTPQGIIELLSISGLGPKKVKTVWRELGVETVDDLISACQDGELMTLKGFGSKTQDKILGAAQYFVETRSDHLYAAIAPIADDLLRQLREAFPTHTFALVGNIAMKSPVIKTIEMLGTCDARVVNDYVSDAYQGISVSYEHSKSENFMQERLCRTTSPEFFSALGDVSALVDYQDWSPLGMSFVPPETRTFEHHVHLARSGDFCLVEEGDIRGVVHCHTTYSDGIHDLEEMVAAAQNFGYEYIVITDHSQAASYANGLNSDRLREQMSHIDTLNVRYPSITIYKGLECDILTDGSMDMDNGILGELDVVIASIHSVLHMDETRATSRLIRAIEHPDVNMLGHPTGRLLTTRRGYPIDHTKVIDACAANGVSIELNSNPHRLDIDWQHLPYMMEKGVPVSINPDAHSTHGIKDIRYGVIAARKGGLLRSHCLNSLSANDFAACMHRKG